MNGKRAGKRQKIKPELTRADIRTCCYFQEHWPTTAALHYKRLMQQQQDGEDAAVEQLWEHSSHKVREQGQADCCAAFQASGALTNSAAPSFKQGGICAGKLVPKLKVTQLLLVRLKGALSFLRIRGLTINSEFMLPGMSRGGSFLKDCVRISQMYLVTLEASSSCLG